MTFGFIWHLIAVASELPVVSSPASQLQGFIKLLLGHGLGHIFGLREEHSNNRDSRAGLAQLEAHPTGRL